MPFLLTSTNSCCSGVRAEQLAMEGSDFLRCLYERANFGIVQIASDGNVRWANIALCRMLGYTQDELFGKALEEIVPPETCSHYISLLRKLLTDGYGHFEAEERFLHHKGFTVTAIVRSLVVNRNGAESYCTNIVHNISETGAMNREWMLASITDMTERNRALQNLQESEERFRTIFNDAPTGMALTSTSGRFIFVNKALCDFLGYGRNELSTKDLLAITYAEDKEATLSELQRMASGDDRNSTIESRYVHKSGQIVWGDVRRSLIRDSETKKPRYIVSQIVDITERKRMEQSLRETEVRFRIIADSAPVLIWMADPDKKRRYFNRRWLEFTGRTLEKERGDSWMEGVHPQELGNLQEVYSNSFDRRVPFSLSYRIKRADGEYRWFLDTGAPRFDPDGSFAGYIGSCIDETDRRIAEDVLRNISRKLIEAQENERKRIARELHDDINQRLAMLAIELQQLDSSPVFRTKRHERIERLLKRTMEISSDLQALSHELHSVTLEHLGVAAAMRGFCNDLARHQKVKIEFIERDLPPAVPPDIALALLRVLQEGVHNAVKHSGVRKLQAEIIGKPGKIQLAIRDLGVGFDPEQAAKREGLGLLSIRERILPFGGTLAITSKPKQGTELVVCVPVQSSLEERP